MTEPVKGVDIDEFAVKKSFIDGSLIYFLLCSDVQSVAMDEIGRKLTQDEMIEFETLFPIYINEELISSTLQAVTE